jgi:hypothetical protein
MAVIIMTGASTGAVAGQDSRVLKSLSDDARKRVYVLVHDGVDVLEPSTRRKVAHITLPGWIWVGEKYSCPPDIALAPEGDILVTSNVVPVIWRIEHQTLATTRHELALEQDTDRDIGFTRLRWSQNLRTFVATTDLGARWHIDHSLSNAQKVSNAPAGHAARPCPG